MQLYLSQPVPHFAVEHQGWSFRAWDVPAPQAGQVWLNQQRALTHGSLFINSDCKIGLDLN